MTTAMPTESDVRDVSERLPVRVRIGQGVLTAVLIACALVALSTMFVDDPFEPAAVVLIASFGTLAAALGLAAVWGGVRSRTVRLGLWALPLFFVWHVAALGTWIPDAVLAVVAASGVVLVTGPTGSRPNHEPS
ncbi:hypothetical protein [Agromyces sp. Marseille-P2726]|uniref:hypothetical protein n=1 Tax=Agromyces sp. Marseille-P2726 TaxID=2709132 RepID=UPI0015704037|nr:hypothetical protein [Agromyces sp. Marseille-P2726]